MTTPSEPARPTTAPLTTGPSTPPSQPSERRTTQRVADPTQTEFLTDYRPDEYPAFAVTVDVVMLTIRHGALSVLLIQRAEHPYRDQWALPGGFVGADEDLLAAARRELTEETSVRDTGHLEQLGTYGSPGRDPRMRVVSVAHLALLPQVDEPIAGSDARDARWWRVADVEPDMLAFDHARILSDAVERARAKLEYTTLATSFTDTRFTLGELQSVYEAVWGTGLHKANFRRKVLATPGFVVEADGARGVTGGRPAKLYTRGGATVLHPALLRGDTTHATSTETS